MASEDRGEKRNLEPQADDEDDEWIGPLPSEAAKPKKKKGLFVMLELSTITERDIIFGGSCIIAHRR